MSKETVKLYYPHEHGVLIHEFHKDNKQGALDNGYYESYDQANERMKFVADVESIVNNQGPEDEIKHLKEQIGLTQDLCKSINKDHNNINKEQCDFSERLEKYEKGQELLMKRISDVDKDLTDLRMETYGVSGFEVFLLIIAVLSLILSGVRLTT